MNGGLTTVLFLDSGAGGLPYRAAFAARNPSVKTVYIADNANFPYGPKSKDCLNALLSALAASLVRRFAPDIIVLACNTASVTALDALRARFPNLPFVGTVPAVKPAVFHSRTGIAGVLGTERTTADPYLDKLLADANTEAGKNCTMLHRAAPELVEFAENEFWDAGESAKNAAVQKYIDYFRERGADALVLGCTHFLLLLDNFAACSGGMAVFHSIDGVCRQIERTLGLTAVAPSGAAAGAAEADLYITGGMDGAKWAKAARYFNLRARALV